MALIERFGSLDLSFPPAGRPTERTPAPGQAAKTVKAPPPRKARKLPKSPLSNIRDAEAGCLAYCEMLDRYNFAVRRNRIA